MYHTARTSISHFTADDFVALHDLFCQQDEVMCLTLKGRCFTLKELLYLLQEKFAFSSNDTLGFFVVREAATNVIMGITGYLPCNYLEVEDVEFGFILNKPYWGKGYATELGQFLINDYAVHVLKAKRVLATVSPYNDGSSKVMEKLDMQYVKEIEVAERGRRMLYKKELID